MRPTEPPTDRPMWALEHQLETLERQVAKLVEQVRGLKQYISDDSCGSVLDTPRTKLIRRNKV